MRNHLQFYVEIICLSRPFRESQFQDSLFNSLPATFALSLEPDPARQNVGPDLDPNCLTL